MLSKLSKLLPLMVVAPMLLGATVVASRGGVYTEDGRLGVGDTVPADKIVYTLDNSFAVIKLDDGTQITVRPNTQVQIKDTPEEINVDLTKGGLRVLTGLVAKQEPENFKISTPVALMGVRGTEFSVAICEDECTE